MNRRLSTISAVLAILAASGAAYADDDVTSLSYISYLERYATLHPGRGGDTLDAVVNMPVLAGDQLETARGARVEVQLAEGSTIWLDEFSNLSFDAIANSRDSSAPRTALYLADGTVAVEIPATTTGEGVIRVDSPNGAVNLNRPGLYRLDLASGQLHVAAFTGLAELPAGMGSSLLRAGQEATVGANAQVETAVLSDRTDDFWSWVQERRQPAPSTRTAEVVEGNAGTHAAALDSYGDWVWEGDLDNWMWRPRVAAGWSPYSYGRWYWTPVGWNWISYEPWGWYPFHYGSWYFDANAGWLWGWDRVWAPAWVHWIYTPGYVGWCPRGYYDWWWAHNCTHCWGEGWRRPRHWGDVAFDFHGRVRFGGLDARPWTIVPSGDFNSSHLERLRLDPVRFREQLGDREGVVRSGPFLTPRPSRVPIGQDFETFFHGDRPGVQRPDLTDVLRREPGGGDRPGSPVSMMHPMRTTDVVATSRVRVPESPTVFRFHGTTGNNDRGPAFDRWRGRDVHTGVPPTGGAGGNGNSGNPPVVRRDLVTRHVEPARGGSGGATTNPPRAPADVPPKASGSPSSSGSGGNSGSSSSQPRQPHQSASWTSPTYRPGVGMGASARRDAYYHSGGTPWARTYSPPRVYAPPRTYSPPRVYAPPRAFASNQGYRSGGGGRSFTPPAARPSGHSSGGSSYHSSSSRGGRSGRH